MAHIKSNPRWAIMFVGVVALLSLYAHVEIRAQEGPQPNREAVNSDTDAADSSLSMERSKQEGPKLLELLRRGGWFMLPLGGMSILVVAISIERLLALRRSRVLPPQMVRELGRLSQLDGGFDPREAFRIATKYPSPAANVMQSMLLKVGRPQSEVEHSVGEASQREADRMHFNVRWLTLCAAVAPLVGLLGTVWGMIDAFYRTTQLLPGQDKAEQLADGIYTALITTLCGLVIAIPAAIFAQFCESKITRLFHEIDEMIFNLMPQIERFEGKVRFAKGFDNDFGGGEPERPTRNTRRESASSRVTPAEPK